MATTIQISGLNKVYAGGFQALSDIHLNIERGEIFALLGPNGAGKTTLISTICGIANPTSGTIRVEEKDILKDYRETRELIGLVPQELTTDAFETVWNTVNFSRGLFGKKKDFAYIEKLLRQLSLWDKKDNQIMTLSGGMKRRVMIAKALSHEPKILFLDEPTAGVDVELRKDMWKMVHELRQSGVTIILTTHYIDEAEEMADRIGVINGGKIIVVEEKSQLMKTLGKKQMVLELADKVDQLPDALKAYDIKIHGQELTYTYDAKNGGNQMFRLLSDLASSGIKFNDLNTKQSSLEDIFVELVHKNEH